MQFGDTFRGAMQEVAAAIDDTMGERVTLIPTERRPNFTPIDRPDKAVTVVAAFTYISSMAFPPESKRVTGKANVDMALPVTTRNPVFSFTACNLPFAIERGYRIVRCVDQSVWDVTAVKPDGISRIVADVVQLGKQSQ